jgi:hypothetical protein
MLSRVSIWSDTASSVSAAAGDVSEPPRPRFCPLVRPMASLRTKEDREIVTSSNSLTDQKKTNFKEKISVLKSVFSLEQYPRPRGLRAIFAGASDPQIFIRFLRAVLESCLLKFGLQGRATGKTAAALPIRFFCPINWISDLFAAPQGIIVQ